MNQQDIEKIWRWSGVSQHKMKLPSGMAFTGDGWQYPELTLDNLFKYAIANLPEPVIFLRECSGEGWTKKGWMCCVSYYEPVGNNFTEVIGLSEGCDNPAESLAQAILEVIEND